MKETIAKALYYNFHNWTTSWEQQDIHIKLPFYGEAEAVIKALEAEPIKTNIIGRTIRPPMYLGDSEEAEAPKELMKLWLSDNDIVKVTDEVCKEYKVKWEVLESFEIGGKALNLFVMDIYEALMKAQLAKVAPYIEAQVKAERERILSGIVEARKKITEEKERQRILEPKDRQAEKAFNSQLKGLQQAIDIVKTGGIR